MGEKDKDGLMGVGEHIARIQSAKMMKEWRRVYTLRTRKDNKMKKSITKERMRQRISKREADGDEKEQGEEEEEEEEAEGDDEEKQTVKQ